MAFEFRLPDIGEGLAEAEVLEWLIDEGASVEVDQPLVQIETDKAVTDIPSPRAGVLLHRGAPEGSVVQVGDLLAVIGEAGEVWGPEASGSDAAPIVGSLYEARSPEATVPEPPQTVAQNVAASEDVPSAVSVQALPVVRRRARELGIDLDELRGSGPGGRVELADVEKAAAGTGPAPEAERPPDERVRMSKLRRTIAANMERSWREIPHVTTFGEADGTTLLEARRRLTRSGGGPIPMEALFIQAALPALREFPAFNAWVDGDEMVLRRRVDIGIAVDTADGLMVGVVRQADRLGFEALAQEVVRLGESIRARTATPAELGNQTFTISNIGAVGGGFGTPIIPWGTTAILSLGRIEDRPVARDDQVTVRPVLPLSLSYDHRAIDGALGRRFLAAVIERLETGPGPSP